MATTTDENLVDGGGDQWQEDAGDKDTIGRPRVGRAGQARPKHLEEFPNFQPMGIYIQTLSV